MNCYVGDHGESSSRYMDFSLKYDGASDLKRRRRRPSRLTGGSAPAISACSTKRDSCISKIDVSHSHLEASSIRTVYVY